MDDTAHTDAPPPQPPIPPAASRDSRRGEFEANKLKKRLRRQVGEAIGDYALIAPGDRVMVCLSGGKDSYGLLDVLLSLKDRAPFAFEIVAVNLDQKQPGYPADVLPGWLEARGVPFRIASQDTYSVVKRVIPEGGTMCSLCSRLRRGVLYRVAGEIGATKIALGHHRDDILATFFLNLFFGGKLKTMPPKLVSDDGKHVVIRPLAYVRERDLARYAGLMAFPIIPCNLCGSQEHLQRRQVTAMLREWEKKHPGRVDSVFNALSKIVPSHLMDASLFDFAAVRASGRAEPDGDLAFDDEPALFESARRTLSHGRDQPPATIPVAIRRR
jgi:tRNA 2-thiocytidine biosynthesis protein TtcA